MKKIAVTGGIASGKSVVCEIIEKLGYKNGIVDKKYIRNEILQDDSKRLALNTLAHSEIKARVLNLLNKVDAKAIFVEIPLIVESGMKDCFDQIW